jgi:hypothetical protein
MGTFALLAGLGGGSTAANAQQVKTVFVIAMENHNWTQPANRFTGTIQQIFQNTNAPFINSLVDGSAYAIIDGSLVHISEQVSYATNYRSVLATPGGNNPHIHPSEPNYLWAEAGTNFGVLNDNDPFDAKAPTNQDSPSHLTGLLQQAGHTWKSYQEDIDLVTTTTGVPVNAPGPNSLTSTIAAQSDWTVPLLNFSGTSALYVNPYNGTHQYDYAAKHNPMVFFTDTNGGCNTTNTNPLRAHYAPLQQLALDLQNRQVADYNWITPNQFNDMHTTLTNGYGGAPGAPIKGDGGRIAQGDNFVARVVPLIMASDAYKHDGVILLWWDESEGGDTADFTLPFIVISKNARANVNGVPFSSHVGYSHSSTLRTMQEMFDVDPSAGYPWLGAAATAADLSALFKPGAIH